MLLGPDVARSELELGGVDHGRKINLFTTSMLESHLPRNLELNVRLGLLSSTQLLGQLLVRSETPMF